jgi:phosphate butyryltransferase
MSTALPDFAALHALADERRPRATVAVAGDADASVREALAQAEHRGWARARFADSAAAAVALVRSGEAQLLMKGQISTPDLLKAILDPATGCRTDRVIGQVVLIQIVPAQRQFLLVDTGICIQPTLQQKVDLLGSTLEVARKLGCPWPRVAIMAASEKVSDAMPETKDALELVRKAQAGEFGECAVQGPLSFDLAYAQGAATTKRIAGDVIGAADVMLFPNLVAANLTVKAIMYTADCSFGGALLGARCPVVFMSRADSVPTRLNSLALALQLLA